MRTNTLLLSFAVANSAFAAITTCNADNCLRAVRATLSSARGSSDCASYLGPTLTASPTTITRTVTATLSPSSTSSATVTDTLSYGKISFTETVTLTVTPTTTITATTSIETSIATSVVFVRRADTNTIPAYASACSGAVRYSSACACIGISGSATIIPGSTSYVTVTASQTLPTALTVQTSTLSTTVPASSTTETDILTISVPPATSVVNIDATTTSTSTSTSTTTLPNPTFCITTNYAGAQYYLGQASSITNMRFTVPGSGLTTLMWQLDSTGHLINVANGYVAAMLYTGSTVAVLRTYPQTSLSQRSDLTTEHELVKRPAPTQQMYDSLFCAGNGNLAAGSTLSCTVSPSGTSMTFEYLYMNAAQGGIAIIGTQATGTPYVSNVCPS